MPGDWIPDRESELVTFSQNFASKLSLYTTQVGITVEKAAQYEGAAQDFAAKFQTSQNPDTRTKASVIAKNASRKSLLEITRTCAWIVQSCETTTDEIRADMGLTVRKKTRSPREPITAQPRVTATAGVGLNINVTIDQPDGESKRGKVDGSIGAQFYSFAGEVYPQDPALWTYHGMSSHYEHTITLPFAVEPGTRVWVTAAWMDILGRAGPMAQPASCFLTAGGVNSPQQQQQKTIKRAA